MKRKEIAQDTLRVLEQGYFINPNGEKIDIAEAQKKAEEGTVCYTPAMSDEILAHDFKNEAKSTQFQVSERAIMREVSDMHEKGFENVVCLNFASAKNPGGGFLNGAEAQEESIARSTGLYPCQLNAREYYEVNRGTKSCFYTDYMIYSPAVPIVKKPNSRPSDALKTISIITAPAVNLGVVKHREPGRLDEVEGVMKRRIRKVLAIALHHGHTNIILGAWGCGVFRNSPNAIAAYFKEVIDTDYKNAFERIHFPIFSRNPKMIAPFLEAFG